MLHCGIVTLFPELFENFWETSFVKMARDRGHLSVVMENLREHGLGRHRSVDDGTYGGGAGMVLRVDCVVAAIRACEEKMGGRAFRVLMTPQGIPFKQACAAKWAHHERILFICGRYEGFDERVRSHVDAESSLGDFVLTGGEIPAMAMIQTTIRLVPGVLGNFDSVHEESFSDSQLLGYPQYTRPIEFENEGVPDVLKSGNHALIEKWRKEQSIIRTRMRRPDLLDSEDSREGKK